MNHLVERMDAMRRALLWAILAVALLILGFDIRNDWHWAFNGLPARPWNVEYTVSLTWTDRYYLYAFASVLALLLLFLMVAGAAYRVKLLRDSSLHRSVDDELVRQKWLKSYRVTLWGMLLLLSSHEGVSFIVSAYLGARSLTMVAPAVLFISHLLGSYTLVVALGLLAASYLVFDREKLA